MLKLSLRLADSVTTPLKCYLLVRAHSSVVRNSYTRCFKIDEMQWISQLFQPALQIGSEVLAVGESVFALDALPFINRSYSAVSLHQIGFLYIR